MEKFLALIVYQTLFYSAPLIFTALGGIFSERSGVVNVGLEGIMVMGAFGSIVSNLVLGDTFGAMTPWICLLLGGLFGLVFSILHAVATVHLRADHIVSGTVLNLIAPALAIFLTKAFYNAGQTPSVKYTFGKFNFPVLANIPVIGTIFFKATSAPAYVAVLAAILVWVVLYKTRFGLRLRSVGENPQAADTLGLDVYRWKYTGVLLSGLFAGIGGAVYAQSIVSNFAGNTIVGQGFISLAAVIFGRWHPIGALLAAMFFGFAQSLAVIGAQLPGIKEIPSIFLQIAPYVITIIALIGFAGKYNGPKANGVVYVKSK
ncbi:ABC transporter permease [Aerococcaceae bacterium zg-B36]|uniref:ABC transporter permease n=1 Tax=Aerococcaceae bacterium zg-252 TaxID=2796928 RepID=UPI001BD881E1|nr:ABC transporter permease [Aerococcaceae bacterium zg-B36]